MPENPFKQKYPKGAGPAYGWDNNPRTAIVSDLTKAQMYKWLDKDVTVETKLKFSEIVRIIGDTVKRHENIYAGITDEKLANWIAQECMKKYNVRVNLYSTPGRRDKIMNNVVTDHLRPDNIRILVNSDGTGTLFLDSW